MGGDEQILEDFTILGLQKGLIDTDGFHRALGVESNLDEAAAGLAFDLDRLHLSLHLLKLRLGGLHLLHEAHDVAHACLSSFRMGENQSSDIVSRNSNGSSSPTLSALTSEAALSG